MQRSRMLSALVWLCLHAGLWWLLAGGGWYLGLPAVVLAALLSYRLQLRFWYLRPLHLPAFLWLFGRQLLAGGWDVARRTVTPSLPIEPAWVRYDLKSADARVRLLLSALVGLLPGTLSTGVKRDHLELHVLDADLSWHEAVAQLEASLDRLLGERSR
ncbi:Na+/H+ antiporter subunit E [Pseudomonas sp.]|uniref:Na+/H+ antiporter subunit E n=1 Tax=Pseudomonas sp. TaxID=306 RepID=UPI00272B4CF1|nr:Na+/H+ antiporter subunit E [Pseudomonas sp.]